MNQRVCWQWMVPLFLGVWSVPFASGFVPGDRWTTTASGRTGSAGDPITLTWSIVPDGTSIPDEGDSDLIAFMDSTFGMGSGGTDLTQRPWFEIIEQTFDRWNQLGGITYLYEPNDDGRTLSYSSGSLGTRGDIRIGGAYLDGASGTLAYNYFPNNGDMVIDTGDEVFFSVATANYRRLRNTMMHEQGHGFGLNHVESDTSNFLMEPYISTLFDGPQFDDIRGIQWFYGDVFEKDHQEQGNDTAVTATSLGAIAGGESVIIGSDAGLSTYVSSAAVDYVSIDRPTDTDYFSFTVPAPSLLNIELTPRGPTYNQGVEGGTQSSVNTMAIGDLSLAVLDSNGTSTLATANASGAGDGESISGIALSDAGEYFVRVTATSDDNIQFYQLAVSVEDILIVVPADFEEDGDVDADDLDIWRGNFGLVAGATHVQGDADADGDVDGTDFLLWQQGFLVATSSSSGIMSTQAVPEPNTVTLALLLIAFCLRRRRHAS